MKKLFLILAMIGLIASSTMAQDRTGSIRTGFTMLSRPLTFTTADAIVTSDSLVILITNPQKYLQHQTFTTTINEVSGSPSITISARGKVNAADNWIPIGTPVTWTGESGNPATITSTEAHNYNYLMLSYVASGATQRSEVLTFDVKTSNLFEVPTTAGTITLGRPTSGTITLTAKDNDVNAALTLTPGGNGALTLGNGTGTVAVNSSDWDISTTGAMTGIGAITADGLITGTAGAALSGAAISLNASSNFATNIGTGTTNAAISIGGGSNTVAVNSSAWDISTAGAVTGLTDVTASGVITGGFKHLAPIACTDGSETLTAAQSGSIVVCSAAGGATTVTLPDPSAATVGVVYYLLQTADQNLIVVPTTADGNSLVCDGVATSDAVTIDTGSHKIGAGMIVIGISATQWYVGGLNPESVLTPQAAD